MKRLRIIHLGYSDKYGGASVAMGRINDALSTTSSIDSKIATIIKSENSEVLCLSNTFFDRIWTYIRVRLAYKLVNFLQKTSNKSGRSINFFPSNVYSKIEKIDYDILHLHWIGNETIRLEDLKRIKKPIVWTFHDTWALLGSEHTDIHDSLRFVEGYAKSNRPLSMRGLDIDKWTWNRKNNIFRSVKIQPIAVSSWLADETKRSFLWKDSQPVVIHNPIEIHQWSLRDKFKCRDEIRVALYSKVIVFGAVNGLSDPLKGYKQLAEAMLILASKSSDKFILFVFGDVQQEDINLSDNLILRSIGKISDIETLNKIYCAADLVAVPSYLETFGQVALEAVTCGTPVIAFKTSGLKDIIIDGLNGFFCKPFFSEDMALKLADGLEATWNSEAMRKDIGDRFGYISIARKYEEVYNNILHDGFI